jgi:phytoene dehydrogenase-like protein
MHENSSDVVVIGGGIGGLASALALARTGKRVTVLESGARFGGRGASDLESGFVINQGPHALYEGSRSILASLGIEVGARLVSPRDNYIDDGERLHLLPAGATSFFKTTYLDARDRFALGRLLPLLLASGPSASITFEAWLERQELPPRTRGLIEMIARVATYGADPAHAAAAPILVQVRSAIIGGVRYVDGGWNAIVEALARGLTATGRARIMTRARALEIEPTSNSFRVHTERESFEAQDVIIAGTPGMASTLLTPLDAHEPPSGPPLRVACLDLGLGRLPKGSAKAAFGTNEPTYVSVHSESAALAPEGQAMVHAALYLGDRTPEPARDRALIEASLERSIPGWRNEVRFERYVPAALASCARVDSPVGFAGRPSVTVRSLSNENRGVHRVGDWIGERGLLLDGVLTSAMSAARACDRRTRRTVTSSAFA